MHVSLLIFPQASDSLCHPFSFFLLFLFRSVLPPPPRPPSHVWLSLLYLTTIPKILRRPTSIPPSRRPPQSTPSPNLQLPTVVTPPRPPPTAPRRTNIETRSTSKGPSPPLGGAAAGAYSFIFASASVPRFSWSPYYLHQDLPSPTKSTSSVSASLRPSTWSDANSPARFAAFPCLVLPFPRNATNSAKKATPVVPVAGCNSNA